MILYYAIPCFPGKVLPGNRKTIKPWLINSINSRITQKSQLKKYFSFIEEFSDILLPFPCDTLQAALYAIWLAHDFKYRSMFNYLSALNNFLKEHSPPLDYKS